MFRAYLDNNIIARIEDGTFTVEDIYIGLGTDKVEFYYSDDHLREAHPLLYTDKSLGQKRVSDRLKLISEITRNRLLAFDSEKNVVAINKFPLFRYWGIKDFATEEQIKNGFEDNGPDNPYMGMPFRMRELYRQIFDFKPTELNNAPIDKIVAVLDKKFIERQSKASGEYQKKWGTSLKELEQAYFKQMDGNPTMYDKIAAIFLLLDLCGYYKDKETERSDFAKLYDSSHATFAAHCDYFISNDKKTRMKAEVAYHYLNTCYNAGLKTLVVELKK
jgi:hypothetical protein